MHANSASAIRVPMRSNSARRRAGGVALKKSSSPTPKSAYAQGPSSSAAEVPLPKSMAAAMLRLRGFMSVRTLGSPKRRVGSAMPALRKPSVVARPSVASVPVASTVASPRMQSPTPHSPGSLRCAFLPYTGGCPVKSNAARPRDSPRR